MTELTVTYNIVESDNKFAKQIHTNYYCQHYTDWHTLNANSLIIILGHVLCAVCVFKSYMNNFY